MRQELTQQRTPISLQALQPKGNEDGETEEEEEKEEEQQLTETFEMRPS